MKLKSVIGVSLIIFGTSVAIILTMGLLLSQARGMRALTYVTDPATGQAVAVDATTGQPVATNTTNSQLSTAAKGSTPKSTSVAASPGSTPTQVGAKTPTTAPVQSGKTATPVPAAPIPATAQPIPKTPTPTAKPVPTPAPAPACGTAGGACSPAQVAAHNAQTNCWVIYGGYYYNVTSYVNIHNGGRAVFNAATCGNDITAYMSGAASTAGSSHAHSTSAYNTLASYRIGPVR